MITESLLWYAFYLICRNVIASTWSGKKSTTMNPNHDWSFFVNLKWIWYQHIQKETIFIIIVTAISIWTVWSVVCRIIIALFGLSYIRGRKFSPKLTSIDLIWLWFDRDVTDIWPRPAKKLDRDILDSRTVRFLRNILLLWIRTIHEDFHRMNLIVSILSSSFQRN